MREADSEVLGRHVLNGVGLVDDKKIVRVKIARAFLRLRVAPSQHDKKETVVEHHKVRRVHPATGLLVKTARPVPTAAGSLGADPRLAADQIPDRRIGQRIKVGQGSVARAAAPIQDALQLHSLGRGE